MAWAVRRIDRAIAQREKIAIWGDFDADGITATAVLWEGLSHWVERTTHLRFYIPNRLTESHGLSEPGLQQLAAWGATLLITCDTGSTETERLALAQQLGLDVIVTDHHTLAPERPPVVALVNPRSLSADHPLADLSGVAVAYKLIEALQETQPLAPNPCDSLLDLVAIGLIADLVALKNDSRYLAQEGLKRLQRLTRSPQERPGVAALLQRCQRSGDRPTDISFGIGPRINAVSRIQGDARLCVELLTSRDSVRCQGLADQVELLNSRRKALQRSLELEVRSRLTGLDLSTTAAIVLAEVGWPLGVLGLVAGQIAQEFGKPTVLLSIDETPDPLTRGSARSTQQIDFYPILQSQEDLLTSFGGHPYAAGLSLPVENLTFFAEGLNQEMRRQLATMPAMSKHQADLVLTVADLGQPLFRALKLLEPCGIGNPVPKLLIRNCRCENARHFNIKDSKGGKVRYIKTQFQLRDLSTTQPFPSHWWGHYRDELPLGLCDVLGELDYDSYAKQYEFRLIAVRSVAEPFHEESSNEESIENQPQRQAQGQAQGQDERRFVPTGMAGKIHELLDWRTHPPSSSLQPPSSVLLMTQPPQSWSDFRPWLKQAQAQQRPLALAYGQALPLPPQETWKMLLGLVKYLVRTQEAIALKRLQNRLKLDAATLDLAWGAIADLGLEIYHPDSQHVQIKPVQIKPVQIKPLETVEFFMGNRPKMLLSSSNAMDRFLTALQESYFRQQYFIEVPLETIRQMLSMDSADLGF